VTAEVLSYSSWMIRQCQELHLPCVELGVDFEAGMRAAEGALGLD
jgi:hypothetical protein